MTTIHRTSWLNLLAMILLIPAISFIGSSVLKYGLGYNRIFDKLNLFFGKARLQSSFGWNSTLLILPGPFIALLIGLLQVIHIEWYMTKEQFQLRVACRKNRLPLCIAATGGLALCAICLYSLGENCTC